MMAFRRHSADTQRRRISSGSRGRGMSEEGCTSRGASSWMDGPMQTQMLNTKRKSRIDGRDDSLQERHHHQEYSNNHHGNYCSAEICEDRIQDHPTIRLSALSDIYSERLFLFHLIPPTGPFEFENRDWHHLVGVGSVQFFVQPNHFTFATIHFRTRGAFQLIHRPLQLLV